MGDPAGIGPEVAAKALTRNDVQSCCRPLIIGDAGVMIEALKLAETAATVHAIRDPAAADFEQGVLDVLDLANVDQATLRPGRVSDSAGRASVDYVEKATELAQHGHVDAVVTGPINKAALRAAGIPHIGHTELLASLTGQEGVTTMLATPGLRVAHVTRHVPLAAVAPLITSERVLSTMRTTNRGLREMGTAHPRLAVAALNPHGGDGGLLGREEVESIRPAVEKAKREDIDACGPIPADSVFFRAIQGEFDAVVAMYHDQGHIAIKTHDFARSVTVTLGLPIVRTSVDHGTAFDIAWQGKARETSMVEAIRLAAQLASRRRVLKDTLITDCTGRTPHRLTQP
jgi:4-hydroxythreonine-4-phosphate dehydrogenase